MSHLSRLGALVAASALTVTGLTLVAAPANAAADPRPQELAADWLAGELVGGLLPGDFGPLYGPSIDAALSLKAAGGHEADVAAVGTGLGAAITSYVDFAYSFDGDGNGSPEQYAGQSTGATAKALVLGQALTPPTTTLGGVNLLTRLESYVSATAPTTGRLIGVSTKDGVDDPAGEYTNVVGQALGAAALHAAGSSKTEAVVGFLLKQQCTAGYFRIDLTFDKTATNQTCDGATANESGADADATSNVIRLLTPQAATSTAVETALEKAEAWLAARQQADGSFSGGTGTSTPNANSTALAGLALGLRGNTAAREKAATWVRAHQVDEVAGCTTKLATETGAIAYDDAALAAGRADGIADAAQQWRIAASQATPILAFAPAASSALSLTAPGGFYRAGSTVTYTVGGLAQGTQACVAAFGVNRPVTADANGRATLAIKLPAGTANRTVTVRNAAGTTVSVVRKALAAKTLTVAAPAKVKKGKTATVVVRGLQAGERVTVTYKGVKVRTGLANPKGVFTTKVAVGRSLGKKVVRAYGQFTNLRRGVDVIKVVR